MIIRRSLGGYAIKGKMLPRYREMGSCRDHTKKSRQIVKHSEHFLILKGETVGVIKNFFICDYLGGSGSHS